MSNVIKSLVVKVGVDLSNMQKGLKQAGKDLKATGKDFTQMGGSLTKGVTVPIIGAVAGLGALVGKSLETADSLSQMSDVTGLSTERLQELKYAGTKLDVELETMTGAQSKLIKAMSAAQSGTQAQADAFKMLGVSAVDSNGNLRDSNTVFMEAIDALGGIQNETERDAISLKLFGKSAMELNPLIKAGSTELSKLTTEAHKNGAVMSGESVKAMDEFGDKLEAAKLSVGTAAQGIAVKLMPSLEKLLPIVQKDIVPAIGKFADFIGSLITKFSELTPSQQKLIGAMTGLAVAIGPAFTMIGKLTTGVGGAMTAISKTIGVVAGGGGFTAALSALVGPAGVALLVVGALAALTAAVVLTKSKMDAGVNAAKDLAKSFDDSAKSYKENTDEIRTNSSAASDLTTELYALSAKENKSNAEKLKMVGLVDALNKAIPDLSLGIDKQTGALDRNEKSVRDLIAAKKKELEITAAQERMVALYKERLIATDNLNVAQEDLAAIQKKVNDATAKGYGSYYLTELKKAKERVATLTAEQGKNAEKLKQVEASYDDMADTIYGSNDAIVKSAQQTTTMTAAELTAQKDAVAAANTLIKAEQDKAIANRKAQQDAEQKALEDHNKAIEDATSEHLSQMGSLENNGIEKTKLTAAQVKRNLDKQIADFKAWRESIKTLSSSVPADVMAELEKLGPEAMPIIQGLNKMSKTELAAWVATWREKGAQAKSAAVDEVNKAEAAMKTAGENAAQGFADGLKSKLDIVKAEAAKLGKVVPYSVRKILEIESPSRVLRGIGGYASEGFAIGLTDNLGQIRSSAVGMSKAAMPSVNMGAQSVPGQAASFTESGSQSSSVAAQSRGDTFIFQVGGKTILETVITERDRRNARAGRNVISVGV